jgi:hypothetical protein
MKQANTTLWKMLNFEPSQGLKNYNKEIIFFIVPWQYPFGYVLGIYR